MNSDDLKTYICVKILKPNFVMITALSLHSIVYSESKSNYHKTFLASNLVLFSLKSGRKQRQIETEIVLEISCINETLLRDWLFGEKLDKILR